ncbi:hypothetical protein AAC387_Pa04g3016 [Persea americana]
MKETSRTPEKAKRFAAENGFPETVKTYGSYEAVLDDPNVDAVYVPLPTALHLRWAVEAAEKKKHALLERPTAMRVHSIFTFLADSDYLENNIRVKPDLDGLGALVTALPGPVLNKAGVILSCGASLLWEDGTVATLECSFLANLTMDVAVLGTKDLSTRWRPFPSEHIVETDLPQEALMIKEFATLVGSIRDSSSKTDKKWPTIARKTQLVLDAVKLSVENGCAPVNVVN